jgi:hypothetical protein
MTNTDPWAPENLVPLSLLVAEGFGGDIDTLAKRLGDDLILDDIGIRCTTRVAARALFVERETARERANARNEAARQAAASRPHIHDRIKAIQKLQAERGYTGLVYDERDV